MLCDILQHVNSSSGGQDNVHLNHISPYSRLTSSLRFPSLSKCYDSHSCTPYTWLLVMSL